MESGSRWSSRLPNMSCRAWFLCKFAKTVDVTRLAIAPTGTLVEDPVLDIWRRQWLTLSFKPTTAGDAELFLFNLRCVATRQLEVLACSGRSGIYIEPRTMDAPLMDFLVSWLPKTPHEELLRIQ